MNLTSVADRVRHASEVTTLREPAFRIIDRIQGLDPAVQYRALALAFVACSQALGVDPHEMAARAERQMAQAEGPFTYHVQAIRDYAADELAHR